jgi:hypothetical protein
MIAFWKAKVKPERTSAHRNVKKENPSVFASTEGLRKTRMEWEKIRVGDGSLSGDRIGPVENAAACGSEA